jgi:hypothetical protein
VAISSQDRDNRRFQNKTACGFSRTPLSVAERENPWRERLRIESDPLKPRRKLVLKSAHDNNAAGNTIEFIGSHCFALDGG